MAFQHLVLPLLLSFLCFDCGELRIEIMVMVTVMVQDGCMVDGNRGMRVEYKSASGIIVDCNGERRCDMGVGLLCCLAWNCGAFYQRGMDGRDGMGWDGMKQRVFFLSAVCNLMAHLRSLLLNPFLHSPVSLPTCPCPLYS
jgi:hypothetical protein